MTWMTPVDIQLDDAADSHEDNECADLALKYDKHDYVLSGQRLQIDTVTDR